MLDHRREVLLILNDAFGHERRHRRDRRGDGEEVWPSAGCFSTSCRADRHHAAGLVLDDDLPAFGFRQGIGDDAGEDIGRRAAEFGTTMRMTFDGNDSAEADWNVAAPKPTAAVPVKNDRRSMAFIPRFVAALLGVVELCRERTPIVPFQNNIMMVSSSYHFGMRFSMPWNDRTKRRLKLRDLDILMAVIDSGSMGKAAKRLDISQPAVSKAIVELEDALGVRLRRPQPARHRADAVRAGAAKTQHLDLQRSAARRAGHRLPYRSDQGRNPHRHDRAGHGRHRRAGDRRLSRKYPEMYFHIVAGDTGSLYRDVANRNIEFAICRMIGRLPDELDAEVLFQDSVAIMTAASNPLTRRRNLTLADLLQEPWVFFPYDSFFGSMIGDIFRKNGVDPPRQTFQASPSMHKTSCWRPAVSSRSCRALC